MVAPELFHRTIPRLCAQTWRACAIPERTAAAHARRGLQQGVRRLSTALSPIPGDKLPSLRPDLIHRDAPAGRLIRKHPDGATPRPAWRTAISPPAIHSLIPSLCAQALDIAGFLSDSRKPAAALARSGHPPACAQLHPQLSGISTRHRALAEKRATGRRPRRPRDGPTYPHAAHRTIPAICAQAPDAAAFLTRHEKAPGH